MLTATMVMVASLATAQIYNNTTKEETVEADRNGTVKNKVTSNCDEWGPLDGLLRLFGRSNCHETTARAAATRVKSNAAARSYETCAELAARTNVSTPVGSRTIDCDVNGRVKVTETSGYGNQFGMPFGPLRPVYGGNLTPITYGNVPGAQPYMANGGSALIPQYGQASRASQAEEPYPDIDLPAEPTMGVDTQKELAILKKAQRDCRGADIEPSPECKEVDRRLEMIQQGEAAAQAEYKIEVRKRLEKKLRMMGVSVNRGSNQPGADSQPATGAPRNANAH